MPWAVALLPSSVWEVGAGPGPSLRLSPGHLCSPLFSFLVPILSLVLDVGGSGPAFGQGLFGSGTGSLSFPLPLVGHREGQDPSLLCVYSTSNVAFRGS